MRKRELPKSLIKLLKKFFPDESNRKEYSNPKDRRGNNNG